MTDAERDAVQRDLGRLEARVGALERDIREIDGTVPRRSREESVADCFAVPFAHGRPGAG